MPSKNKQAERQPSQAKKMKARWESKSKSCTKESCGVLHIFSMEYNAHQPATAGTQTD